MVCPDYFVAEVGDIKTDFAHTINVWETVPPIVNLLQRGIPIVVAIRLVVLYTMLPVFGILHFFAVLFIEVPATVTFTTHYLSTSS